MDSIVKRGLDILISACGVVVLLPYFVIIGAAIKIDDRGPVFFRYKRVGKDGQLFHIYKFRTMVVNAENLGTGVFVEENDLCITRVGKLLRHLSRDELPQLFNVLKGDMSLVGPRPTLLYQVERYDERQKKRLKVKPGMTSWAQVNGRNELTWPERIELDLWYIDNWSFWFEIKIF